MRGCAADWWAMAGSDAVTLTRGPSATRWGAELTDGPGRIWKISNTIWTEFVLLQRCPSGAQKNSNKIWGRSI
jgi:hypothetical protein